MNRREFLEVCASAVGVGAAGCAAQLDEPAVDENTLDIEDQEVYVWSAVNVDTFEILHVEVSPGRFSLDALLFLKEVLKYCRGRPESVADRGG